MSNLKPAGVLTFFVLILFSLQCKNKPAAKKNETNQVSFELVSDWPQLSQGFQLGQPTGIGIDTNGHIFVFHRAGEDGKNHFPIQQFHFPPYWNWIKKPVRF